MNSEKTTLSATPPKLTGREMITLQLAPGVVSVLAYAILAWFFTQAGIPKILALMLAVPLAEVPFTWWLMIRRLRRETRQGFSFKVAFPWWGKVPVWVYLVIGIPVVLLNVAFMMIGQTQLDPLIIPALFGWVPDWFVLGFDPQTMASASKGQLLLMWGLSLVGMTMIGGFTQEIYARGFLLPRMAHLGWKAPIVSAGLFAVMHFVGPWAWPIFFINALLWAWLAMWRKSAKIALFGHMGMLFVQWLMLTMIVFGFVQMPG